MLTHHAYRKLHFSFSSFCLSLACRAATGSLSCSISAESFKDSSVGESERKKVGGGGSRRRGGVQRRM